MRPFLTRILLVLMLILLGTGSAGAVMVELDPATLTALSDATVIGTVRSVESRWAADGGTIETVVRFTVDETVAGADPGDTVSIIVAGGTVGDVTQWVEDEPSFFPGQEAGLFLTRAPDRTYRVTGLAQGQYLLEDSAGPKSAGAGITAAEFREFVSGGSGESADASVGPLAITPTTASAGTDTAIAITGSGFGTKASRESNADVLFYFVSDGLNDYYMPASGYAYDGGSRYEVYEDHIVSWSDSQIVVRVPTGLAWRGYWYGGSASSGPVYVLTDDGREFGPYSLSVPFGWSKRKWSELRPTVAYYVNPGSAGEALLAVQRAANTWSITDGSAFAFAYGGATAATSIGRNYRNEIIWGSIDTPGVVAQASTWSSGSTVLETDIKFNTYYTWSANPGYGQMDIESVCLHELGHWTGLTDLYGNRNGYPSDTGKVMYGRIGYGQIKRALTAGDLSGIRYIYPDSSPVTPTVTGIAPAGGYDNCSSQTVTINGAGFKTGDSVGLTRSGESPIAATGIAIHSPSTIACTFDLAGEPIGAWNVVVTSSGGLSGTLAGGFTILSSGAPPVADFAANRTSGKAPLAVAFTDTSTGSPTAWTWSFGDGTTSTEQHPVHLYDLPGTYGVNLTVSNGDGSDTRTVPEYVTVFSPVLTVTAPAAAPGIIPTDTDGAPGTGEVSRLSVVSINAAATTLNLSALGLPAAAAMTAGGGGEWILDVSSSVPSPFADGAYEPVLLPVSATDADGAGNTSVTIPLTVVKNGDANEDNRVTLYDAVYVARHTLGMEGYPMTESVGMVSGGESISLHDAMYLARHVLGIPGYETLH